jgi:acetyl esterase/lipase
VTAPVLLAVLGALALLGVANAVRPARTLLLLGPSWLAAWITVELAPHLVVLGTALGALLAALGGLSHPAGWVGLAALAVADAVAIPLILRARRTRLDIGSVVEDLEPGEAPSPYPRLHVAMPFLALRRRGVRHVRGVEYARRGNLRLKLDVYRPAQTAGEPRPGIVQVHGGGWIMGSRREQGIPLLNHLAANGWVGFNVDYRLSPRATFPDHVVDVKEAIAWVREHADDLGVDPSFIALTGGSAGGHLSALAALTAGEAGLQPGFEDADTSVAACVPFYGVYDFLDDHGIHPSTLRLVERLVFKARRDEDPERFRAASPLHQVHVEAPPFLVVHGDADSMIGVEEARRFVARLRETSTAPVLYAEMRGGQHAFDILPSWRTIPVIEAVERFLATVRAQRGEPAGAEGRLRAALSD